MTDISRAKVAISSFFWKVMIIEDDYSNRYETKSEINVYLSVSKVNFDMIHNSPTAYVTG